MAKVVQVESKDTEGKVVNLVVRKPTQKELTKAQIYASRVFKEACDNKMCFRNKLEDYLIDQGEWTEESKTAAKKLEKEIEEATACLKTARAVDGKQLKLSEGRAIALDIKRKRLSLVILRMTLRQYDAFTVEGYVENARFDYLVHLCTYKDDGVLLFETIDAYLEKSEEPYANKAAETLMGLVYEQDPDAEKKLPENEFLLKYKFVDESLHLIDKTGKLVNVDGKLVDKEGNLVDENGQVIKAEEESKLEFVDDVFV